MYEEQALEGKVSELSQPSQIKSGANNLIGPPRSKS